VSDLRQRILIVDDDPDLRSLLTRYLSEQGINATTVEDGVAMDRFLESSKPVDLIILNLMLPGEDGLSIARRLIKPLARLAEKADEIGTGQFPPPMPEHGPNEIAALARGFNHIAYKIKGLLAN